VRQGFPSCEGKDGNIEHEHSYPTKTNAYAPSLTENMNGEENIYGDSYTGCSANNWPQGQPTYSILSKPLAQPTSTYTPLKSTELLFALVKIYYAESQESMQCLIRNNVQPRRQQQPPQYPS
jgi:hypothetical protein